MHGGEAQDDTENEGKKSGIKCDTHVAEHFSQRFLNRTHVSTIASPKHFAESSNRASDTNNGSDETHDGDCPEEYFHHRVTSAHFRGIYFRLRRDHFCYLGIVLADVEKLERLTNPVHDVGVTKWLWKIDDVIVKILQIVRRDFEGDIGG